MISQNADPRLRQDATSSDNVPASEPAHQPLSIWSSRKPIGGAWHTVTAPSQSNLLFRARVSNVMAFVMTFFMTLSNMSCTRKWKWHCACQPWAFKCSDNAEDIWCSYQRSTQLQLQCKACCLQSTKYTRLQLRFLLLYLFKETRLVVHVPNSSWAKH